MKIILDIDGKTESIETTQYFLLSDKGCSYSGAFEWLIGQIYFRLQEIKKKYNKEDRSGDTPRI